MKHSLQRLASFALLLTFLMAGIAAFADTGDELKNAVTDNYKTGLTMDMAKHLAFYADDATVTDPFGAVLTKKQLQLITGMYQAIVNGDLVEALKLMMKLQNREFTPEQLAGLEANRGTEEEKQIIAQLRKNMEDMAKKEAAKRVETLDFESVNVNGDKATVTETSYSTQYGKTLRSVYHFVKKDGKWVVEKHIVSLKDGFPCGGKGAPACKNAEKDSASCKKTQACQKKISKACKNQNAPACQEKTSKACKDAMPCHGKGARRCTPVKGCPAP